MNISFLYKSSQFIICSVIHREIQVKNSLASKNHRSIKTKILKNCRSFFDLVIPDLVLRLQNAVKILQMKPSVWINESLTRLNKIAFLLF